MTNEKPSTENPNSPTEEKTKTEQVVKPGFRVPKGTKTSSNSQFGFARDNSGGRPGSFGPKGGAIIGHRSGNR